MTNADKRKMKRTAERLARQHLSIETLDARNSDSLDFHEVSVWSLRDALEAAYAAGHQAAADATKKKDEDPKDALAEAIRQALTPHAVALIAAKCQPRYAKGEAGERAERESAWFANFLIEDLLTADEYHFLCEEIGV